MIEALDRLSQLLGRLPGVGRRSAGRMASALARDGGLAGDLAAQLQVVVRQVAPCSLCGNLTLRTEDPCRLCSDTRRDPKILCVVEDPLDIQAIESAGVFRGRYHALMGRLSPMRGEGVANIRVDALLARVPREQVGEVILALGLDTEGEATAHYLATALAGLGVQVTRLARGLPSGGGVGYADATTLGRAIEYRQRV